MLLKCSDSLTEEVLSWDCRRASGNCRMLPFEAPLNLAVFFFLFLRVCVWGCGISFTLLSPQLLALGLMDFLPLHSPIEYSYL